MTDNPFDEETMAVFRQFNIDDPTKVDEPEPDMYARDEYGEPLISHEPIKEPIDDEPVIQNSGMLPTDTAVLVPHVSPEETERNAPSYGKKMVAVRAPEGVSVSTFYDLLSNAYALYVTEGAYDADRLVVRTGAAPGIVAKTLASPQFKHALRMRGVVPNATGLTNEQDYFLLVATDPSDGRTLQQKMRALDVSYAKYRAWMRQPVFRSQIEAYSNGLLMDNTASITQLARLAGEGDLNAIKYMHTLNGTYNPDRQNQFDAMQVMSMMLDVIARHVKDPAALSAIAGDMRQIAVKMQSGPTS